MTKTGIVLSYGNRGLGMKKNEITWSVIAGVGLIVVSGLIFAAQSASEDALRIWCVGCTVLVPVTGYVAWTARGMLSRAEHNGLQTGMTHTLDVVRAVRPSSSTISREIVTPGFGTGAPALPDPGSFEILTRSGNVIEL